MSKEQTIKITETNLKKRVTVMFLTVVNEPDSRLEVLPALLVPELTHMATSLPRLASISGLDHLRSSTVSTEATFCRYEVGVLVSKEFSDEGSAGIGVLWLVPTEAERLCVVAAETAMSYPRAGREHELVVGVAVADLVVRKIILVLGFFVRDDVYHFVHLHIVVAISIFPFLVFLDHDGPALLAAFASIGIRGREVVEIGQLQPVFLCIVGELAVALVQHVFPDGVEGAEVAALAVAVEADIADGDLLAEVSEQAADIGDVFGVGDEERMRDKHVREVVFYGGGRLGAEEALCGL